MWATMLLIMTKFLDVSLIAKRSKIEYSRTYKIKTPKIELPDIQGVPKKGFSESLSFFNDWTNTGKIIISSIVTH